MEKPTVWKQLDLPLFVFAPSRDKLSGPNLHALIKISHIYTPIKCTQDLIFMTIMILDLFTNLCKIFLGVKLTNPKPYTRKKLAFTIRSIYQFLVIILCKICVGVKLTISKSQQATMIFYKSSFKRNNFIWLLHSHVKLSVPESHTNEI